MLDANGMALNVLANGEPTSAAGMTLVFNLSLGVAWVLEVVAMVALMVGLLLLSNEGRRDKNHHLNNDFIPGPAPTAF